MHPPPTLTSPAPVVRQPLSAWHPPPVTPTNTALPEAFYPNKITHGQEILFAPCLLIPCKGPHQTCLFLRGVAGAAEYRGERRAQGEGSGVRQALVRSSLYRPKYFTQLAGGQSGFSPPEGCGGEGRASQPLPKRAGRSFPVPRLHQPKSNPGSRSRFVLRKLDRIDAAVSETTIVQGKAGHRG